MSDCPTCIPAPCGLANDLDLYNLSGPAYPFVLNCPPGSTCNARKVEIPCGDDVVTVDIPTGATPEERRAIILEALTACLPKRIFDDPRPIDPDSPPILLYGSRETSCTVYCSSTVTVVDGVPVVTNTGAFTYRFAAGAVLGYTQAEADFNANRLVCVRAKQHLVCLSAIQKAFCVGEGFEATIKAKGQFVSQFPSTDYWEISGTLPPGLTFHGGFISGGKAVIDGTPTTAGLYTFTVKITLGSRFGRGDYMERTYSLAIVEVSTATPLPPLVEDQAYTKNLTLVPTHDQETEVWSVVTGTLPPGLELTPQGVLHGTPTDTGAYPFTVSVTATVNGTQITCEKDFTFATPLLNGATDMVFVPSTQKLYVVGYLSILTPPFASPRLYIYNPEQEAVDDAIDFSAVIPGDYFQSIVYFSTTGLLYLVSAFSVVVFDPSDESYGPVYVNPGNFEVGKSSVSPAGLLFLAGEGALSVGCSVMNVYDGSIVHTHGTARWAIRFTYVDGTNQTWGVTPNSGHQNIKVFDVGGAYVGSFATGAGIHFPFDIAYATNVSRVFVIDPFTNSPDSIVGVYNLAGTRIGTINLTGEFALDVYFRPTNEKIYVSCKTKVARIDPVTMTLEAYENFPNVAGKSAQTVDTLAEAPNTNLLYGGDGEQEKPLFRVP